MMAAGIKPCCLIWSGVSDDGSNPQYDADYAKICLWMTTVSPIHMTYSSLITLLRFG